MNIKIYRLRFHPTRTVGQLYINGEFFCFTLEDKVREEAGKAVEKWKVQDETAIPTTDFAGYKYRLTLEKSPRFGADCPTIHKVPGFAGIRFHSGNTETHTEGCLVLGYRLNDDGTIKFGTTKPAVRDFVTQIKKALQKGQKIDVEIKNLPVMIK